MPKNDGLLVRFIRVQAGMRNLMLLARHIRTGDVAALPEHLQMFEDAVFTFAGELLSIPSDLADRELMVDHELEELGEMARQLRERAVSLDRFTPADVTVYQPEENLPKAFLGDMARSDNVVPLHPAIDGGAA